MEPVSREKGFLYRFSAFKTLFCIMHFLSCLSKDMVSVAIFFGDKPIPSVFDIIHLILLPIELFTFHFADSKFLVKSNEKFGACVNIAYLTFVLLTFFVYDTCRIVNFLVWFDWKFAKYILFIVIDVVYFSTLIVLNFFHVRIRFNQKNVFTLLVAYLPLLTAFIPYFKVMVDDLDINEFFMFVVATIYFINKHRNTDYNPCVSLMLVVFGGLSIANIALYFITIQMYHTSHPTILSVSQGVTILCYLTYYLFVFFMLIKNARSKYVMFSRKVKDSELVDNNIRIEEVEVVLERELEVENKEKEMKDSSEDSEEDQGETHSPSFGDRRKDVVEETESISSPVPTFTDVGEEEILEDGNGEKKEMQKTPSKDGKEIRPLLKKDE